MIKELIKTRVREIKVNITASEIDSVRKKDIVKSGCRVYDGEHIGVAGIMGDPTEETRAQAENNLALELPYPYAPASAVVRRRERGKEFDQAKFIKDCERLLNSLTKAYPDIIFSNAIYATEYTRSLTNDVGADLFDRDMAYIVGIIIKHKDSVAVFDTALSVETRGDFVEEALAAAAAMLPYFTKNKPLPKAGKAVFAMPQSQFLPILCQHLSGEAMARGSSMFADKLGKKVFADDLTFYITRGMDCDDIPLPQTGVPFFDGEGTMLACDKLPLIEHGTIVRGIADKRCAAQYNIDNTASGGGTYDNVPYCDFYDAGYALATRGKTLKELLGGKTAILIDMMSGGDCTNDGRYASPVQLAYLVENGDITGRLPELNMAFDMYTALNSGFIGVTADKLTGDSLVVFEGELI